MHDRRGSTRGIRVVEVMLDVGIATVADRLAVTGVVRIQAELLLPEIGDAVAVAVGTRRQGMTGWTALLGRQIGFLVDDPSRPGADVVDYAQVHGIAGRQSRPHLLQYLSVGVRSVLLRHRWRGKRLVDAEDGFILRRQSLAVAHCAPVVACRL